MDSRRLRRWFLDPWVILGALFFGGALLVATLLVLWLTRSVAGSSGLPTAIITVIPMPTPTPTSPTPTPVAPVTPTATPLPLPPPGDLEVGAYVEISGTGGDGLRLRVEPGLESQVRMLGGEAEVFQVRDGPRQVDGYTWWYLVAPVDETRNGWAVSNYLAVVQNP